MTDYNYKEPTPQDNKRTMGDVKNFISRLKIKVHDAVTNGSTTTKQPLAKAPNQNG